ncbi:MAG: hypothetical protein EG825_04905 [Rhodocyclaceae bacterium]|nr:hypothetical protein [Rhodocyclaceae bacterium]
MAVCALALLVPYAPWAGAEEAISICFNYGCLNEEAAIFADGQLEEARRMLAVSSSPEQERAIIALVMGKLYAWAGKQTPIWADQGGNYNDDEVNGRMDCIDHSTTTTRFLEMLEFHGWLRFHKVLDPVWRYRFIISQHASAAIEELGPVRDPEHPAPERYVVDTWFRDNGQPAVILPLEDWLSGGGSEDGE